MNKFNKEQLQKLAEENFEKIGVKRLYATSDGQLFIHPSRAKLHAGKGEVYEFNQEEKSDESEDVKSDVISIKDLTAKIAEETNLELLNQMLLDEIGTSNRKGAIAAITARIDKLTEAGKA